MLKTRRVTASLALVSALFLLLASPLASDPACSTVIITTRISDASEGRLIRNAAELSAALQNTRGGDVFILASGNYGALTIATAFSKPVTLRSVDPKSPACFTELRLKGTKNIILDGLVFDYAYTPGDRDSANKFSIQESHNITIVNSVFDGDYNSGAGHGRGLRLSKNSSVILENNVFRKWWKAVTGGHGTEHTVRGNEIYDIRSDGMAFGGVDGLIIQANHLHNFRGVEGSKDHRDMLQIMRASNLRSTNVTILDNIFDMGAGGYAQTIWMGGDGKDLSDPLLRHQNVMIENNVIYNAHAHGISVHGIDNLSIRKNSIIRVRRAKDGKVTIPRINVSRDSTFVVIEQNVTSKISGYQNQKTWAVLNNVLIQDTSPGAAGYYDREFIYYAVGSSHGYHEYGVRPGSTVDRLNAGSTLMRNYPTRR